MPFVFMIKLKNLKYFIIGYLPPKICSCFIQSRNLCLNVLKKNSYSLLNPTPNEFFFHFANRKMDISQEKDHLLIHGKLLQVESK